MTVRGYPGNSGETWQDWSITFPEGYHLGFRVDIHRYSKMTWTSLTKIEIWADFGEDKLDWEFCLDDLEVRLEDLEVNHSILMEQQQS